MTNNDQHSRLHEILEDLLHQARTERSEDALCERQKSAQD